MIKLQRFIDKYFGAIIIFILAIFTKFDSDDKTKPSKFLVIKLWAAGDSVLSLSLINAVKEKFNGSVDVLCRDRNSAVFLNYEKIDGVYRPLDIIKKIRQYDVVFDCEPYFNISAILAFFLGRKRIGFSNQYRSRLYNVCVKFDKKQHMVQNYLDMIRSLGIKYDTKKLEKLKVNKKARLNVEKYLTENSIKKTDFLVGITPGVAESASSRMWFEDRFAELGDLLTEKLNAKIIFIDSQRNNDVVNKVIDMMKHTPINASGRFSLNEVFYLIEKCKIYISNDTGPMHIAAAQGCRTIGLFGPNTPVLWGPYGKNNVSIYKTALKPSIQNDKGIFPDEKREGFMGPITVRDVFKAVKQLLR